MSRSGRTATSRSPSSGRRCPISSWSTGGGRWPKGGRAHPPVLAGSPGVIRARVVTWPAPPSGEADGVYGVRVTGLSAEGAQAVAQAWPAHGMWVRRHDGDAILQGPASLFAGLSRRATGTIGEAAAAASTALARFREAPRSLD